MKSDGSNRNWVNATFTATHRAFDTKKIKALSTHHLEPDVGEMDHNLSHNVFIALNHYLMLFITN